MGTVDTVLLVTTTNLKNSIQLGKILDGAVKNAVAGLDRWHLGDSTASFGEYEIFGVWQILRCGLPGPSRCPVSPCPPPTQYILKELNPYVSDLQTCEDLPKVGFQDWFGQKEATGQKEARGTLIIAIFSF